MNLKIKQFFEDLELLDSKKASIVKGLYKLFFQISSELAEKFIYGGIGFYINDRLIGGIYVNNQHISLVFSRGNELFDKYKILLGQGKWRRHISLISLEDIADKYCSYYIEQVVTIETKTEKHFIQPK